MLTVFRSTASAEVFIEVSCRAVSTKYPIPHPRPYRRRLYEAALAPVLPVTRRTCPSQKDFLEMCKQRRERYSDLELALVDHVKKWIKKENFRTMAVCQQLSIKGPALWLAKNQFRLKGLEYRLFENRIVKKLFEGTPFSSLDILFDVADSCLLFGKDLKSISAVISECKRYPWIEPLAITYDLRILSVEEVRELCRFRSVEDVRAETVQLLDGVSRDLVSSVFSPLETLSFCCDSIKFSNVEVQKK